MSNEKSNENESHLLGSLETMPVPRGRDLGCFLFYSRNGFSYWVRESLYMELLATNDVSTRFDDFVFSFSDFFYEQSAGNTTEIHIGI